MGKSVNRWRIYSASLRYLPW